MPSKLIETLYEVVPSARRLAILLNETDPSHALFCGLLLVSASKVRRADKVARTVRPSPT